jgi:VWFA-related protein
VTPPILRPIVLTVLTVALLAAYGPGRALAAEEPPMAVVGETIDVRVINVEAVVTDGRGQVVHGLTAADLALVVDGKEVPIDYFTEVRDGLAAAAGATPTTPPATAPAPPGPAPQVSPGSAVGRSYLVFVDDGFAVAARRDAALRRLAGDLPRLRPEDRMAVVVFDGSQLEALSGWSGDAAALAAGLRRATERRPRGNQLLAQQRSLAGDVEVTGEIPEAETRAFAMGLLAGRASPEAVSQLHRSAAAAAAALRGFELPAGRRIMLLLSAGWSIPAGPRFYAPLVDAANQLGYTVYPMDVATGEVDEVRLFDGLAARTGGHAISGAAAGLSGIAAETASYYWLGFSPAWPADDRRHGIEVRARRQGLSVRSRQSFSDLSRRATATMKAESALYFGASRPPPGASGPRLGIEAGVPRASGRGALRLEVTLLLPVSALAIAPDGDGFAADLPLVAVALDRSGDRVDLPASRLHIHFAALPRAAGVTRFRTTLELRRIDQRLVFAVPDAKSGAVLTADLEVHPPT